MSSDLDGKYAELEKLRARVRELEAELENERPAWAPHGTYSAYDATAGFLLGMFGAAASLLVNVIGAPIAGKSPLELIRVYLTFPLGEQALSLAAGGKDIYAVGDGVIVAGGVCLYLGTGMLLGVPFYTALARLTQGRSTAYRFVTATLLATALWIFNFWCVLSWLQPLLFGGRWITDPQVLPIWVGWVTHLVFGWTLAAFYPWTKFQAYQRPATSQS